MKMKGFRQFFLLLLVVLMVPASSVNAEKTTEQLRAQGIYFVTPQSLINACNNDGSFNNSFNAVGKRIFFIGDSLTLGMTNNGLLASAAAAGIIVNTANGLSTDATGESTLVTTSAEVTNGIRTSQALEKLKKRADPENTGSQSLLKQADFGSDKADVIVIGLGTNHENNFKAKAVEMIRFLRTANPTAKIYWTKINLGDVERTRNINQEVDAAITESGDTNISVIDPSSDASLKPNIDDGIHFTRSGYIKLAAFVIGKLVQVQTAPSPSSDPPYFTTPGERSRYAWSYFANEKGLSSNAVAGIMGNLNSESGGIDPHNVENEANGKGIPDGPEIPISAVDNEGTPFLANYGYGIAQWTIPSRQENFYGFSLGGGPVPFDKPRSSGNLRYQLDYIWYELESRYFDDVLAVLKDPNVTLNDASDKFALEYEIPRKVTGRDAPRPPAPPETEDERIQRLAQNAIDRQEELDARRLESQNMMNLYNGSTSPSSPTSECASSPSTGEASNYIPDCSVNNGNAAIACTAINQLMGIPYSQDQRAGATDPTPDFLDCSALVGMAIYRAFGVDLGGICSLEYLSNSNFEAITDLHTIQPGDLIGRGTRCGENEDGVSGHIAIVVSYDPGTKKLVTIETGSSDHLSGMRGTPGSPFNPDLALDRGDSIYDFTWGVRYTGNKTLQPGAN